jgi:integrase
MDGNVYVFRNAFTVYPDYAIAIHSDELNSEETSYPVIGGFRIANHNGIILPVSLYLRAAARGRMDPKTAASWATDLKHWVEFFERLRCRGKQPPYAFNLFDACENDLLTYKRFLREYKTNHSGDPLSPKTWSSKINRVCIMYQWWTDQRWYHRTLGPRAKLRGRSRFGSSASLLAHLRKPENEYRLGPMGSVHARIKGYETKRKLPRTLTWPELNAVSDIFQQRFQNVEKNTPKWEQYVRDELIFSVGRLVGLRVDEITNLPTSDILRMDLTGMSTTMTLSLYVTGKFKKKAAVDFPVELLKQLQTYGRDIREKAICRSGLLEPENFFVGHVKPHRGKPLNNKGIQAAIRNIFIEAGLFDWVVERDKTGHAKTDMHGQPLYRPRARHSIHDLRHTYAVESFYAKLVAFGGDDAARIRAMEFVKRQLRHANIETTQNIYAELTESYSSWLSFSEGLEQNRKFHRHLDRGGHWQ